MLHVEKQFSAAAMIWRKVPLLKTVCYSHIEKQQPTGWRPVEIAIISMQMKE